MARQAFEEKGYVLVDHGVAQGFIGKREPKKLFTGGNRVSVLLPEAFVEMSLKEQLCRL